LRTAAIAALGGFETRQADELLIKAVASDPAAEVRLEAITSLGLHQLSAATFAAQKQALLKDSEENVRLVALKNLWRGQEAFPEIRLLVKVAAEQDSSKEVRRVAASIIAKYPESFK
jgi:HEAT repeat protein